MTIARVEFPLELSVESRFQHCDPPGRGVTRACHGKVVSFAEEQHFVVFDCCAVCVSLVRCVLEVQFLQNFIDVLFPQSWAFRVSLQRALDW